MSLKKKICIVLVVIIVFLSVFIILMTSYRKQLDSIFDIIAFKNLESYNETIKVELEAQIQDIHNSMVSICSGRYNSDQELKSQLEQINKVNTKYQIHYATLQNLKDKDISETLVKDIKNIGNEDIFIQKYQTDKEKANDFVIIQPVFNQKELQGIIYSQLELSDLIATKQSGFLRNDVSIFILKPTGESAILESVNFIESLRPIAKDNHDIDRLLNQFQTETLGSQTMILEQEKYYFSFIKLDYNDWMLLSSSTSYDLTEFVSHIYDNTTQLSLIVLIATGVILLIVYIFAHQDQKKRYLIEQRFELLAKFSDIVIAEYNIEDDILLFTSNSQSMLKLSQFVFKGFRKTLSTFDLVYPDDWESILDYCSHFPVDDSIRQYELRILFQDNVYHWCKVDIAKIYGKNRKPLRIIFKITDNSKQHAEVERLKEQSQKDDLTGLYQKNAFIEQVESLIQDAIQGTFMILDLDDFKVINDSYGHSIGDQCLQAFGDVLIHQFRKQDIIGRYGGDEFEIFIKDLTDIEVIQDKVLALFKELKKMTIEDIQLSCSIGITVVKDCMNYQEIFDYADQALYIAKGKGKNQYFIIENSIDKND